MNICVLTEGSSDHLPLLIKLPDNITILNPNLVKLRTDWDSIKNDLNKVDWPTIVNPTETSISNAAQLITSHLQVALLNNTKGIPLKSNSHYLLPKGIFKLINRKRDLNRKFRRCRNPSVKTSLNQISRQIRQELKKWELHKKVKTIQEIDEESKRWKILREWKVKRAKIGTLMAENQKYSLAKDKANLFAKTLEEKFTEHPEHPTYSCQNKVKNFRTPALDRNTPTLTPDIVSNAIDSGISNKSPGNDEICYKILKLLNINAIEFLTKIFNAITKIQHFPQSLKIGIITMIVKPGKPTNLPSSYRPITLLPTIAKVCERCQLSSFLLNGNSQIIPDEQRGFRSKHSIATQLTRVSEILIRIFNRNRFTIMTALDVEAAFDKGPFKHLLFKMHVLKFPDSVIRLLSSYFTNRTCKVNIENELSEPFTLKAGVAGQDYPRTLLPPIGRGVIIS